MIAQTQHVAVVDDWAAAIASHGMCSTSVAPEKWHPLAGFSSERYQRYAAWACPGCPVLAQCAAYGQLTKAEGIYGGQYRPPRVPKGPWIPKVVKTPPTPKAPPAPTRARKATSTFREEFKSSVVRIKRGSVEDRDPNWRDRTACGERADLPWTDEKITASDVRAMSDVCRGCAVFEACAALRDEANPTAGFWAGQNCNTTLLGPELESSPWVSNPPPGPPAWARPVAEQLELGISTGTGEVDAGSLGAA